MVDNTLADIEQYDTVLRALSGDFTVKDVACFRDGRFEVEIDAAVASFLFGLSHAKMKTYREMLANLDGYMDAKAIEQSSSLLTGGIERWRALHEQCQDILDAVYVVREPSSLHPTYDGPEGPEDLGKNL